MKFGEDNPHLNCQVFLDNFQVKFVSGDLLFDGELIKLYTNDEARIDRIYFQPVRDKLWKYAIKTNYTEGYVWALPLSKFMEVYEADLKEFVPFELLEKFMFEDTKPYFL